jgi:hypothetical protein
MKKSGWLTGSFIALLLLISAPGKAADNKAPSLGPPTTNLLVLSTVTGKVRVLDSKGLVIESNYVDLPRIDLSTLSPDELQALLETKKAYAALTTFTSSAGTNSQSEVIGKQLRKIWKKGKTLQDKIQTRLEILDDLRDYNLQLALLPGDMVVDYVATFHSTIADDKLADREAEDRRWRLRESYNRAEIADYRTAVANQAVADCLAKCAALSARLATHGIEVPNTAPFYPVPALSLRAEVDAARRH